MYGLDLLRVFIDSLFLYIYSNPNPSFPVILTQNLRIFIESEQKIRVTQSGFCCH